MNGSNLPMAKKNLLLTYCFPPFPGPESYLAAKLFSNMPNSDFDVVTITPVKKWMSDEFEFTKYVTQRISRIDLVNSPHWVKFIPLAKRDVVKSNSSHVRQKISSFLWKISRSGALILKQPDPFRVFNKVVYRHVVPNIREYENILTWSQYHSTSLVGLKIKRKLGNKVKWAAYFGDPWHLNPYVPLKGITKKLNFRLQSRVFKAADLLLFPTQEMADFATKGYGSEIIQKSRVLPHSFDEKLYSPKLSKRQSRDMVVFKYIGQFYGARRPELITQGIALLLERRPDFIKILKVEFVGSNIIQDLSSEWISSLPKGIFTHRRQVGYLESLSEMTSADCLISLDAPASNNIFMSGKLSDYIGARKPIIAITNEGATANLISNYGGWLANPEKPEEVADAFEKAITYVQANREEDFGSAEIRAQMDAGNVAKQLLRMLSSSPS
jgi:glycosyltransferase involved in cell wall biosynthesis